MFMSVLERCCRKVFFFLGFVGSDHFCTSGNVCDLASF